MKSIKVILVMLLIAQTAFCHPASNDEMEGNDLSEDENKIEGRSTADYDPSFLDEILGPDYFDEETPTEKLKSSESDQLPKRAEDGSVIEPQVVTSKPYCTGCPSDVNTEDAKVKEIALYAFNTYSTSSSSPDEESAQSFVRVLKAQTQVVAGYKYILKMELGYLNCSKAYFATHPESCTLDSSKETVQCDFEVVEKAWLNQKEVIKSECEDTKKSEDGQDETQRITEENLEYESEDDGNIQDDIGMQDETTTSPLQRRKRETVDSSSLSSSAAVGTGRLREADEDKETIMEMARFATQQLDTIDEDDEARLVIEVINVKKQTVAGWLYHLKLRVAQTSCKEGEDVSYEKCKDKIQLPFTICNVKVLFQPWQEIQKKVTESQCFPEKMKRSKKLARKLFPETFDYPEKKNMIKKNKRGEKLVGAPKEIPADSPGLEELVNWAVESVDQQSNAMHAQKLVQVVHAERQIVNGVITRMTIETGYTNCRKSPELDKSKCDIDENRAHQFCKIAVWEKPWLKEKKITESKCGKSEEIMKRKKRDATAENTIVLSDLDQLEEQFGSFISKYEKKYKNQEEYEYRLGVFRENMKKVKFLQDTEQGTGVYGATIFADLTDEEFGQRHLGLRPDLKQKSHVKQAKIPQFTKIPKEFDWRHYNAVTPVKNQGSCGSCWAFSVTGNIEGLYARKHNNLLSFSEQELVDCDTLDDGCGGGLPENAYKALQKIGGLEEESAYPYDGKNEKCHFKSDLATAQVTGFVEMPKNETQMAAWLVKNGPISIGINANAMQFYFGGVSHPWKYLCSPKQLDHGVLIVGYGVYTTAYRHKVMPYWLVKNSWGPHWGEAGYYRVFRGDGTCGVNMMATSAVIA